MIISRTPLRISFFGGGTDYPEWINEHGGKVISTTINKYIYLSCRFLPPFFNHKYRISYSKIDLAKNLKQISHRPVREIIKYLKIKEGLEIHYDADLPAKSGMGSSSAFVVGLLNVLYNFKNKVINDKFLAEKSIFVEQNLLKEIVGLQDQIAIAFGGFNLIKFKKKQEFNIEKINIKKEIINKLNKNLFLIYTGLDRRANDIAKSYIKTLTNKNYHNLKFIMNSVDKALIYLKNNKLDDFGYLLHESWVYKRQLSKKVTNFKIDYLYNKAIKSGALGGKLLGAGGGGFMMLYVSKSKHDIFRKSFQNEVLVALSYATQNNSQILFICDDNDLSVLTPTKDRRRWKLVDVAKSFGLDAVDITDDPWLIDHWTKKLKNSLPALINIRTCRDIWHVGSGKDKSLDWNRFEITKKKLKKIFRENEILEIERTSKLFSFNKIYILKIFNNLIFYHIPFILILRSVSNICFNE